MSNKDIQRATFEKAYLSANGFHTKAELEREWQPDMLSSCMFRAGWQAAIEALALSDEQISKIARYFSDFSSVQCGVDKDDAWAIYGNDEIELVRAALATIRRQQ